ncbi:MAG TPA: choice-of-anchor Q domain-containing protein [Armatimonadota bacterium]
MRNRLLLPLVSLALASLPSSAADWYVTTGGTGTQTGADWDNALPTISKAMQLASSGDTISVWVGGYHERITLKSGVHLVGGYFFNAIRLPFWSIIDGDGGGSVVTVQPGSGPSTVLNGFTLQNGSGTRRDAASPDMFGGGIYCANAKPTLQYNHITGCRATYGGGIYLDNAAADISLCHFTNNRAVDGAGIFSNNGSPPIYICTFLRNVAYRNGGAVAGSVTPLMMLACNTFEANSASHNGGAVFVNGGTLLNNTFIRNTGAAGAVFVDAGNPVQVVNNIVSRNETGVAIAPGGSVSIHHNDVVMNALFDYSGIANPTGQNGNISADPALADPLVGDYTPCPGSPCIDKGDDSLVQTGWNDYYLKPRISGVSADIGAAEWQQPTAPKPLAVRVRPDGDDANDGADWAHPKRTIQAAVDSAILLDREVWVAAGTYGNDVNILKGNVMLYGGFAGDETMRNQRNPAVNKSIIDRCLVQIADLPRKDNRTIVDGFTIHDGRGYSSGLSYQEGGGLDINGSAPIISGNTIEGNYLTTVDSYGGGLYVGYTSSSSNTDRPYISCNVIQGNYARVGGGIYITYSDAYVRNNVIEINHSETRNTYPGFGGGIATEHATATITGNTIRGNHADSTGGGIYCYDLPVVVRDNAVVENTSDEFSAGIHCSTDAQILNNVIRGNVSSNSVGGLSLKNGTITLANNLIAVNKSTSYAGGLWAHEASVNLYNNTFASNDHEAVEMISTAAAHTLNVANNIITGSATGILINAPAPSTVTLSTNCVFGNITNYTYIAPGASDIQVNPLYVNATGGDYRLLPASPAIDVGTDSAATGDWDLDGRPRIQGSHVDMGAYEYVAVAQTGAAAALTALKIAAGLQTATPFDKMALDVESTGTSNGVIDLGDAVRLLRMAAGL